MTLHDERILIWRRGTLDGRAGRQLRPWGFLIALVGLIFATDGMLSLLLHEKRLGPDFKVDDSAGLNRQLDLAIAEAAKPGSRVWLLVGDSVLAGDVLAPYDPDWSEHRVIDHMRGQKSPESPDKFFQIALNGLLPADLERIVGELDQRDPDGRVKLLVEVNPRYFSRQYAELQGCTRPWLDQLDPPFMTANGLDWKTWVRLPLRSSAEWIRIHAPIFRHVWALSSKPRIFPPDVLAPQKVTSQHAPRSQEEGFARMTEHYANWHLESGAAQADALARTVNRIARRRAGSCFFATPLNRDFMGQAVTATEYGALLGRVAGMIEGETRGALRMFQLDHPLFRPEYFVDHCHLKSEGNRLLALNLLHQTNVGLSFVPSFNEMVHPEDVQANLVYSPNSGSSDGAAWMARFKNPQGLAASHDGRVIVVDTGNHCLRQLEGSLQTIRTIAGKPGEAGVADGSALEVARLTSPGAACFLDDVLYFADESGRKLRHLTDGRIETDFVRGGPSWWRIDRIRGARGRLYLLDHGHRVLEFDPVSGKTTVVLTSRLEIAAIETDPQGSLYVSKSGNGISEIRVLPYDKISAGEADYETLPQWYSNPAPSRPNGGLPSFFFERPDSIRDLVYSARYGGMVVLEEMPRALRYDIPERSRFCFLKPSSVMRIPWIQPNVFSLYEYENTRYHINVTRQRIGLCAADPLGTGMYFLEDGWSRLYREDDGLWGASRTGDAPDFPPSATGAQWIQKHLSPEQFLDERSQSLARRGPYTGLMMGSSLTGYSDLLRGNPRGAGNQYAMGRVVENRLRDLLGYQDLIRFDMSTRVYYGHSLMEFMDHLEDCLRDGSKPDVIFVEVSFMSFDDIWQLMKDPRQTAAFFDRVSRIASQFGSLLVFAEMYGISSADREGLRPVPDEVRRFLDAARERGFFIAETTDQLVRDYLEKSPWGSPPYAGVHGAPWAIDATGSLIAERVYPKLREFLDGRKPAWQRELAEPEPLPAPEDLIGPVLGAWEGGKAFIADVPKAIRSQLIRRNLNLNVDLGRSGRPNPSAIEIERIVLGVLSAYQQNALAEGAVRLNLKMFVFAGYDEYGEGATAGATTIYENTWDAKSLRAFLNEHSAADMPTEAVK